MFVQLCYDSVNACLRMNFYETRSGSLKINLREKQALMLDVLRLRLRTQDFTNYGLQLYTYVLRRFTPD